ncbi:hypothetical protein AA23498_0976 [Acetobacter nitrogenifigens DSM 23921 = NBRC 105050]|uniref:Uncharacterized protein n=1 Tax=Acetobacter nitrogenifigens DSM 23921 = NBRC 105050 TaxID=1120919 RepID=A0A511XB99_9PROT|nr:hypothetical protein [Acetobacter nitrogenifigens]GBQ90784.1 hypothetical protein AA23498_0976 [Acetobacter nitrogenifigens DSM 23921 = NBRC 105050]GEN60253.1 hypothetical protein ANI02nite_21370 [Acetobacter nitrogenifigens DSM 23921 = NBRC 105050]
MPVFELSDEWISVISLVGNNGCRIDFIQKGVCFGDVGPLPSRQGKSHDLPRSIDSGLDLRDQSAPGPSDGLIRTPFKSACTMLMCSDDRAVDHHVFIVAIGPQMPEIRLITPLSHQRRKSIFNIKGTGMRHDPPKHHRGMES